MFWARAIHFFRKGRNMKTYKIIKTVTSEFTIYAESEDEAIAQTENETAQYEEEAEFEAIDITIDAEGEEE